MLKISGGSGADMPDDLWSTLKRMFRRAWPHLKKTYFRKSVLSVFIMVGLWNALISSDVAAKLSDGNGFLRETIYDLREVNARLQIRFYQILSSWRPVPFTPNRVTLVYIDDWAHWTKLWGAVPTPRDYLATLIKNASLPLTKANVIALDVELFTAGSNGAGEDDDSRKLQDDQLLKAIVQAANQNVHVVLPTSYYEADVGRVRIPNIFRDSDLPLRGPDGKCAAARACVSFGFVNAPPDRREIPLRESMLDWDKRKRVTFDSFAFATVNAAEEHHQTKLTELVEDSLRTRELLLGSFVAEKNFDYVLSEDLYVGNPSALQKCNSRIVMIGGRWHLDDGHSPYYADAHFSPAGEISGLAFHANYVESLLNPNALSQEVGLGFSIVMDLLIGMVIYAGVDSETKWLRLLMLIIAFAIAPVLAYLALISRNVYLDFLLPSELYFIHILYEYMHHHHERRSIARISSTKVLDEAPV